MKNRIMKAIIAIVAFTIASQADAYFYRFASHIAKEIAVAIKFKGSKWYEFCVVKPGEMGTIGHGNKYIPGVQSEFPSASAGLVPSQLFYYFPKPGEKMTIQNQQSVAWRAIDIEWMPSESYNLAINLAEKIATTGETVGKTAAKAGAAYMTGGTSTIAEGVKKVTSTGKADALKAASSGEYGLSGLISAMGKSAARSLIGDHHFDIVQDEDGKLRFISQL